MCYNKIIKIKLLTESGVWQIHIERYVFCQTLLYIIEKYSYDIQLKLDYEGELIMYDVVIIGAGVSGSAIARELSRYEMRIGVLEKAEDVCCQTSKANSGIVHAGHDAPEGSLMAELNLLGNKMMEQLSKDLDIPFERNGSLVLCTNEQELPALSKLYDRGLQNGVKGLRILSRGEVLEMEPNVTDQAAAALYAPSGGIVCPFELNIAMAENAYQNGVEFLFHTEVFHITKTDIGFLLETSQGRVTAKYVVNAAGVYADVLHNMVSRNKLVITPRRGDYILLDKSAGSHVSKTIFALPNQYGKGILVTPTTHGNLLVGPTAIDVKEKEAVCTTKAGLDQILSKAGETVKNLPLREVITSFAGLRATMQEHDFIIEEVNDAKGFVDCAGIASPGLSSCPAIGVKVAGLMQEIMARDHMHVSDKSDFISTRKGILRPSELSLEARNQLIREQPAYGTIVCRCEMVTEGEVIDAIKRPLGAKSLDGIKRRTRAGMGRCQAGFCSPRTMELIAKEYGIPLNEVTKSGGHSHIIAGVNKEWV